MRGWLRRLARWWARGPGDGSDSNPPPDDLVGQLRDLQRLHEATLCVARTRDWNTALHEIMRAALEAVGTDKGLLSVRSDGDHNGLRLAMAEGFSAEFVAMIPFVPSGRGACGAAFKARRRVIVRDADTDPVFIGLRDVVEAGRFKACHAVPLLGRDGEAVGVLSVHFRRRHSPRDREIRLLDLYAQMAVDFIERWQGEAALRSSERQKQQLLSVMPAGVYTCDLEGRITFFNDAAVDIWGRTPQVAVDRWCGAQRLFRADGTPMPHDDCLMAIAAKEGRCVRGEEVIISRPDGTVRHVLPYPEPIRDATGQVVGVVNILVDVTQLKVAERAQRQSDSKLKQLMAVIPVGVFACDAAGTLTFYNRHAAELWGWSPVVGERLSRLQSRFKLYWPDGTVIADGESPMGRALRLGEAARDVEFVLERGDGRRSTLSSNVDILRDESGNPVSVICAFHDITARRESESALRQSEERMRLATQTGKVGVWDWDAVTNRITWSDSLFTIHGLRKADFEPTLEGFAALIHPEDRARVMEAVRRAMDEDAPYELEFRVLRPDGNVAWVLTTAGVLRQDGRPVRLLGATLDITQRKNAEEHLRRSREALLKSEDFHRAIAELTSDFAWSATLQADGQFAVESVTAGFSRITGYGLEELQRDGWEKLIHPEEHSRLQQSLAHLLAGEVVSGVMRHVTKDGQLRWMRFLARPLRDESGRVSRVVGSSLDITDQRRIEIALRESEERLRAITESIPVLLMRCNAQQQFVFANRAYLERRGVTLGDLVGRSMREVVGDEAYTELAPYIEQVLRGETVKFEVAVDYPELGERQVSVSYVPERAHDGSVAGWIGSITDITEHKRADVISRQLAAIVESSTDSIISVDLDGVITSWNKGAQVLFGYTAEETLGRDVRFLIPENRQAEEPRILERIRAGERIEHFQTVRRRKDGQLAFISLTVSPIKDASGTIVGASKIARDITELHLAQEALRQRTRVLEAVNRVSSSLVAELNLDRIVQSVTEAGREVAGTCYGAFYSQIGRESTQLVLHSIAGAAWSDAESIGLPQTTAVFESVPKGDAAVRLSGENPAFGRPLPAGEWIALPVISRSGEVLGGMLFGGEGQGRCDEETERILAAIAAQAAMAIDNAKLYHAVERELTEKRRAEADLLTAQTQLQAHASLLEQKVQERTQSLREAITQMEEFSYTVSHDLRAPLRAMNTYAQALVEDYGPALDGTARHYLERIQRSSQRMEKLTHDVLTYSRLARSEIQLTTVDLDALLRDMVYQYAEFQPPHAEIKIKRPLHDVRAHEVSLGQCIANLLTNAVKFVAPGVQPKIRIHTELRDGVVRLWIADNGIGIDPQYQVRLFQVFERLNNRQQYEGTGIGLAIVRKAVDKMGGRCGVESDGANGSRFWIELPHALPAPHELSPSHAPARRG